MEFRHKRAMANYHFRCECVACTHKWPVYDRLVDRPPQYRRKLTPDLIEEVARQAANYEVAMELLVRLDINKALPILAEYLMVISDIIVHPDARWVYFIKQICAIQFKPQFRYISRKTTHKNF